MQPASNPPTRKYGRLRMLNVYLLEYELRNCSGCGKQNNPGEIVSTDVDKGGYDSYCSTIICESCITDAYNKIQELKCQQ